LTNAGIFIGTMPYAAPEAIELDSPVDHRYDIYSIGILMYELLTGRRPFYGSATQLAYQHLFMEPAPPSAHNKHLIPSIDAVVTKALAKKRDHRFNQVRDLAHAFESVVVAYADTIRLPPFPSSRSSRCSLLPPKERTYRPRIEVATLKEGPLPIGVPGGQETTALKVCAGKDLKKPGNARLRYYLLPMVFIILSLIFALGILIILLVSND
jgi:serine/threonine protein kinase